MHNIGNKQDAELILKWIREGGMSESFWNRPQRVVSQKAPNGWKYVGHGAFRSVWLSPDGVVYKVDHTEGWGQSSGEAVALLKAWKKAGEPPKGCRLPHFDWFEINLETVIAMEYVHGKTLARHNLEIERNRQHELRDLSHAIERFYNMPDMHEGNVMVDEGEVLVPVDFG